MLKTGQRFGRLTAIRPSSVHREWIFQCSCGETVSRNIYNVRHGKTSSCGCLAREQSRARLIKHGHTSKGKRSPALRAYEHLLHSGDPICKEWRTSFERFLSDMGMPPSRHSILRKDDAKPHGPGNSVWIPTRMARQGAVLLEHQGKIRLLKDIATIENVDYKRLQYYISQSVPVDQAVETIRKNPRKKPLIAVTYEGEVMSLMAFAAVKKVNYNRLIVRVRQHNKDPLVAADELLKEGDKPPKSQKLDAPRKKPKITPSES